MWYVIRKATPRDFRRLEGAVEQFIADHSGVLADLLPPVHEGPRTALDVEMAIDTIADTPTGSELRQIWESRVAEALQHPHAEGIAFGNVGYMS